MTQTKMGILCEQAASTEGIFITNLNIIEVFWGPVSYVESKKHSDNQPINLNEAQQTRPSEVHADENVNIKTKNKQWQMAQIARNALLGKRSLFSSSNLGTSTCGGSPLGDV